VDPGVQGAFVIGAQGCGVSTPDAAAVAAATWGLLGDMHIPNEVMFTFGSMSWMLAAEAESPLTAFVGITIRLEGALPIEHASVAPLTTSLAMRSLERTLSE
jgi:hypothetical protein